MADNTENRQEQDEQQAYQSNADSQEHTASTPTSNDEQPDEHVDQSSENTQEETPVEETGIRSETSELSPDAAENEAEKADSAEEAVSPEQPAEKETQIESDSAAEAHDDDEHDDDDDSHDESEDDVPDEIDFSNYSQTELVAFLDQAIKEANILKWAPMVKRAKEQFEALFAEKRQKALAKFLEEEGNTELDFEYPPEMVDRNWRELYRTFVNKRKAAREAITKEREQNLFKKNQLLDKLKVLTEVATDRDSYNQLQELQQAWREIGMVPANEVDSLNKNYRFLVKKFFDQRALIKEFLELDRKKNLESKKDIVEQIKALSELDNLGDMMRSVKKLQETWKDVGPVPKESLDELMEQYRAANDAITKKKEQLLEAIDEDRRKNLLTKEALIEKVLELTDDGVNKTWVKRNKELAAIIEAWKQVGAVPKAEAERVRREFREAVKIFNKLKNTFFKEQKREKMENLQLKVEACEKVEKLLQEKNLHPHRQDVIKIQRYWKTLGTVPRKESDAVWKRFRTACDSFFNQLKEVDSTKLAEQQEHFEKKMAICEKLEKMAEAEKTELADIQKLEAEYNALGFVPISKKKEVEQRFREASKAALSKAIHLDDVEDALAPYKTKVEDMLRSADASQKVEKERMRLQKKIQQQKEELDTLETNVQFFANSAKANELIGDVQTRIERLNKELNLLKKQKKLLQKSSQFLR